MGSTGHGSLGDYDIVRSNNGNGNSNHEGIGNRFELEPKVIQLEDVATSPYYISTDRLPQQQAVVVIGNELFEKRMVVVDVSTSLIIGNLPTSYQVKFIKALDGIRYEGYVYSASEKPIPSVNVVING